ncbi:methionyl-tRNA formyltransferase [Salinicoccus roseus]|uniref:methionyl-tRNA formyltransferase n=1 Tax=Salinicoccus roseus TaxID=45670 RepID=UPI003D9FF7A6
MNYVLFVGSRLGYNMLKLFCEKNLNILQVFVEKEHSHEHKKYYEESLKICNQLNIPVTLNASSKKVMECIDNIPSNIDYIMSFGYRRMISQKVIDQASIAALGSHFSPLPRYRGFAPLNWLLINGEDYTAVNLFYLDKEVDNGDIVSSKRVNISYEDDINTLFDKCLKTFETLMIEVLPSIEDNNFTTTKQKNEEASYTCARAPEDGKIVWNCTSSEIYNLVRGLTYPYPGAFTFLRNKKLIILSCEEYDSKNYVGRIPGRVIKVIKDSGVVVLCGDKAIYIKEIMDEVGNTHTADKIIKSVRDTLI